MKTFISWLVGTAIVVLTWYSGLKLLHNTSYHQIEREPITLTVVTVQEERGIVGMIEGEVTVIESVRNAQEYTEGQKIKAYVITERNLYGEERQTIEYR